MFWFLIVFLCLSLHKTNICLLIVLKITLIIISLLYLIYIPYTNTITHSNTYTYIPTQHTTHTHLLKNCTSRSLTQILASHALITTKFNLYIYVKYQYKQWTLFLLTMLQKQSSVKYSSLNPWRYDYVTLCFKIW